MLSLKTYLPYAVVMLLVGCSQAVGPQENEVSKALRQQILTSIDSSYNDVDSISSITIENFEILEAVNIGNDVNQSIEGRYTADLKLAEPFYESIRYLEPVGKTVVEPVYFDENPVFLNGTYTAESTGVDQGANLTWDIKVVYNDLPEFGILPEQFEEFRASIVIAGTDEAREAIEQTEKIFANRAAAARAENERKEQFLESLSGRWRPFEGGWRSFTDSSSGFASVPECAAKTVSALGFELPALTLKDLSRGRYNSKKNATAYVETLDGSYSMKGRSPRLEVYPETEEFELYVHKPPYRCHADKLRRNGRSDSSTTLVPSRIGELKGRILEDGTMLLSEQPASRLRGRKPISFKLKKD